MQSNPFSHRTTKVNVVNELKFRSGGGVWSLDAAWNKRPRVMKRRGGALSTFSVVTGEEVFSDNDDRLNLNTVVIPYYVAARLPADTPLVNG